MGRTGWLDRVRLGLIQDDNKIYLARKRRLTTRPEQGGACPHQYY